ncbi:hypothetical protein CTheo_4155 [Ceratobasidium theobromae]|uniref:Uncharacterized protein n=1 Tax=Ceratobasidium theobromae TaxID=1582974 RepID=A0A5N5QLL4_9AGAM|nr:hypothetical protein CTheo_4155 [Ceratobasidium theobromae]
MSTLAPRYILISQTSLPSKSESEPAPTTLVHPIIHYQYADDAPTAIPLSLSSDAHIIYLDFDPINTSHTQARSASDSIVATGLTLSDAAGALNAENPHLYVVNSGTLQSRNPTRDDPKLVLKDYRERLGVVRQVVGSDASHSETGPSLQAKLGESGYA